MAWAGRLLICKCCKVARGPTRVRQWLQSGRCPGPSVHPVRQRAVAIPARPLREGTDSRNVMEAVLAVLNPRGDDAQSTEEQTEDEEVPTDMKASTSTLPIHESHVLRCMGPVDLVPPLRKLHGWR